MSDRVDKKKLQNESNNHKPSFIYTPHFHKVIDVDVLFNRGFK